jgi:hypothetical protein
MRGSRSIKKHGDLFSLEAATTLNQVDICYEQYISSFLHQHVFALCLLFLLI